MTIKEEPPKPVPLSRLSWDEPRESWLCDMAYAYRNLWKIHDVKDVTEEDMKHFGVIRDALNKHFGTEYTVAMVMEKWMELVMLFEIKYACNGCSMEERGHHIRRDGTVKDDLNESWVHFARLHYLAIFHWSVPSKGAKDDKVKKAPTRPPLNINQ